MEEWKLRGKECSPEETVARAKQLLKDHGFALEYVEGDTGIEGCYSSRLSLVPPGDKLMGTNGKGMSQMLCMASAHGEMMERFSNAAINSLHSWDKERDQVMGDQGRFYSLYGPDQPDCIRMLKERIAETMKEPAIGSKEDIIHALLRKVTIDGDKIPAYPFYSVRKKKVEYLPLNLIRLFTGSNGMAAGNTIEEAIVEGISEIFERYAQERIIEGDYFLPEVPEWELEKYPHIRKVIRDIEADGTRSVKLLDASLGQGLPVLCGICTAKDTGRIGVKFGAHPKMAVALERIFTEGMQGRSVEEFAAMNTVTFARDYEEKRIDHWNTLKCGIGKMPADLLLTRSSDEFVPWPDCSKKSNRTLMWDMIDKLEEIGADVYIRDTSIIGFPAVLIYAAGVSEAQQADWLTLSIMDAMTDSQRILTHLKEADDQDIRRLSTVLGLKNASGQNIDGISRIMSIPIAFHEPGGTLRSIFLKGLCEYRLGNLEKACECLTGVVQIGDLPDGGVYEKAVAFYMEGKRNGYSQGDIGRVLETMYPSVCRKVMSDMEDPRTVLEKVYPVCNGFDCAGCQIRDRCRYPDVREVSRKMWSLLNAYHPSEEEICRTFQR